MIYVLPNLFLANMLRRDFRKVLGRPLREVDRKGSLPNIFRQLEFFPVRY